MKFEIGRNKLSKLVPSAKFGNFIVETRARQARVTDYIVMHGLSDEYSKTLVKEPQTVLDMFELSESGLFTLKRDENPDISLSAHICRDDRQAFTPMKLTSFVEVVPITPTNVHATLPL